MKADGFYMKSTEQMSTFNASELINSKRMLFFVPDFPSPVLFISLFQTLFYNWMHSVHLHQFVYAAALWMLQLECILRQTYLVPWLAHTISIFRKFIRNEKTDGFVQRKFNQA